MSTLRWAAMGGSIFENVCGRMIVRDPIELRRTAEQWMREAVALEESDFPRAKLYARDAFQAQLALSLWEQQRKASGAIDPFKECAA